MFINHIYLRTYTHQLSVVKRLSKKYVPYTCRLYTANYGQT